MSDFNDQPVAGFDGGMSVGRRGAMRRIAALSVAPAIAGSGVLGFAGAALAATSTNDSRLRVSRTRYAIRGGRIIDGYFAAPRGKINLGMVVVIHDEEGLDAKAEDTARRYALAGYQAIAPDLRATFRGDSRDAMLAELVHQLPNLKRSALSNGKVSIVAA